MIAATDIERIIGSEAVDQDNDRIGKVSQVYLDSDSERPTWATVKTGLFGTSETLVPLDDADWDDGTLRLAVDKARVKGAPRVDPEAEISVDEQQRLYAYYGFSAQHDDDRRADERRVPDRSAAGGRAELSSAEEPRTVTRLTRERLDTPADSGSDGGSRVTTTGARDVQRSDRTGAHVATDDDQADNESLSYSRSDSDTSDLDAGIDAGGGGLRSIDPEPLSDEPRTGVVGTAADRTLSGRDGGVSGRMLGDQRQGTARLRRYVIVDDRIVPAPEDDGGRDDLRR